MRIFLCHTPFHSRAELSAAARQLLGYACGLTWGIDYCPEIAKRPNGKPFFPTEKSKFLSISHSGSMVLLGLGNGDIGVDIEKIRPVKEGLEQRLLSGKMAEDFELFEAWTLRESIFKLTEEGSLMDMELKKTENGIVTPFENVICRSYPAAEGYAIAAAAYFDGLPEEIEIVDYSAISP